MIKVNCMPKETGVRGTASSGNIMGTRWTRKIGDELWDVKRMAHRLEETAQRGATEVKAEIKDARRTNGREKR